MQGLAGHDTTVYSITEHSRSIVVSKNQVIMYHTDIRPSSNALKWGCFALVQDLADYDTMATPSLSIPDNDLYNRIIPKNEDVSP